MKIGIMASQISGHLATPNNYESIATTTLSTNTSTITFSSIPATYKHLQVRALVRETSTSNGYNARFNSDSGSNYARHYLIGDGSSAAAAGYTAQTSAILSDATKSSSGANIFGASVCDILDYTNTNKYTTIRTLGGFDNNGDGSIDFLSGLWLNTAAITTITIIPDAGNFATYSSFALYGVK